MSCLLQCTSALVCRVTIILVMQLCLCMNACMSVPRVGPGLSANVDKEQMATLTGQKTSSFPHSRILFSLWQHGLCDRDGLDLYLNAPSCIRQKRNKTVCSLVHALSSHGVIKLVMGARQCWPALRWKDIQNYPRMNRPVT